MTAKSPKVQLLTSQAKVTKRGQEHPGARQDGSHWDASCEHSREWQDRWKEVTERKTQLCYGGGQ